MHPCIIFCSLRNKKDELRICLFEIKLLSFLARQQQVQAI